MLLCPAMEPLNGGDDLLTAHLDSPFEDFDDKVLLEDITLDETPAASLLPCRLEGLGLNSIWNFTPEEGRNDFRRQHQFSTVHLVPAGEPDPMTHNLAFNQMNSAPSRFMRDPHPQFRNTMRPDNVSPHQQSRQRQNGHPQRTYDDDIAHLAFYKTVPCKYRNCKKGDACPFAHGPAELRTYKTAMCKAWEERGFCVHGDACTYAHGEHELRSKSEFQRTVAAGMTGQFSNTVSPPTTPVPVEAIATAPAEIEAAFAQVKVMRMGEKIRVRHLMENILKRHHGNMMSTYSIQIALNERKGELRLEKELTLLHVLVFGMMFPKVFRTNVQTHIISLAPGRRTSDGAHPWSHKSNSSFNKLTRMELGILGQMGLLPHIETLEAHGIDYTTLMKMDDGDVANLHMIPSPVRTQIMSLLSPGQ